jgi:hypothetical protein
METRELPEKAQQPENSQRKAALDQILALRRKLVDPVPKCNKRFFLVHEGCYSIFRVYSTSDHGSPEGDTHA